MGTVIRGEVSKKNMYWIEKHRYYELKQFCLQFPYWKKCLNDINYYGVIRYEGIPGEGNADPTARIAMLKERYRKNIDIITSLCGSLTYGEYVLKGVTEGLTYEHFYVTREIPCSRKRYYEEYRKFFFMLDRTRD